MMEFVLPAACYTWVGLVPNSFVVPRIAVIVAGCYVTLLWGKVPKRAFVFLAVMLLATMVSSDPWRSLRGLPTQWSGGLLAAMVYVALLACPAKGPWLAALGIVLSVHALAQQAGADMRMPQMFLPAGRSVAYMGSKIDLGAVLAMAAPVTPWWGLPILAAGMWAGGTRAAALAAAFVLVPWRWRWIFLPALFYPFLSKQPRDVSRVELWRIAAQQVKERPWLGFGPETFHETFPARRTPRLLAAVGDKYRQAHSHNDLLEAASGMGLIGLAAYLWLIVPFLVNPSLLALFIILKFDPVHFEILAMAAVIAAGEWAKRVPSPYSRIHRFGCWVLQLCLHCEQPLGGRPGRIYLPLGEGRYSTSHCHNRAHRVENA